MGLLYNISRHFALPYLKVSRNRLRLANSRVVRPQNKPTLPPSFSRDFRPLLKHDQAPIAVNFDKKTKGYFTKAKRCAELLAILEALPPESWSQASTVMGAGKVLERTVFFYAQWLARYERSHFKQVERLANLLPT